MPLTMTYNVLASNNQQPEYQNLWEPGAVIQSSSSTSWNVGSALMYTNAGIGATPGPSGDTGSTAYTVQTVDLAATTTTLWFAGVLLGVGTLGANLAVAPNTIAGPASQIAMVGKRGIAQLLCDNTTTVGHTVRPSTSTVGAFSDSGGATITYGTHVGVVIQAVTISSGTALVWCKYNAW